MAEIGPVSQAGVLSTQVEAIQRPLVENRAVQAAPPPPPVAEAAPPPPPPPVETGRGTTVDTLA